MSLTKKQIKFLKGLAHHLPVQATVGKEGLSEAAIKNLKECMAANELVKVKISAEDRETYEQLAEDIASQLSCQLVQCIGRMAIFYLPYKENSPILQKRSRITLPV